MIYYQLLDSSVVNGRLCQEISKFKVSVHLSMVIKSSEGITFSYFKGKYTYMVRLIFLIIIFQLS